MSEKIKKRMPGPISVPGNGPAFFAVPLLIDPLKMFHRRSLRSCRQGVRFRGKERKRPFSP